VQSQLQLPPVPGVWACLEPAVQATYPQQGDQAVALSGGFFLPPATFLGCDSDLCAYTMRFEATTAARLKVSATTLTVWLDGDGRVAFVGIADPVR